MTFLLNPRQMTFDFIVPDMEPSEGVQKIAGFSRGWHHWNSVRLGIRKENDYCMLYAYVYRNGERIIERMGKVNIGDKINVILEWEHYITVEANVLFNCFQAPFLSNPIGYQLGNYAEKDYTGKRIKFNCEIFNLKIK